MQTITRTPSAPEAELILDDRRFRARHTGQSAMWVGIAGLVGLFIPFAYMIAFPSASSPAFGFMCITVWLASLAAGIIGIVLGTKSRRRARNGYGTSGLVTGIIGTALNSLIVTFVVIGALAYASSGSY